MVTVVTPFGVLLGGGKQLVGLGGNDFLSEV